MFLILEQVFMSQKEADRLHVIKLILSKQITQKKAANLMGLLKSEIIYKKSQKYSFLMPFILI